jgi:hypothetical protein
MGHLSESCAEPQFSACSVPRGARSAGAQSYQVLGSRKEEKRICWVLPGYEVFRWSFAPGENAGFKCIATQCDAGWSGVMRITPPSRKKTRGAPAVVCGESLGHSPEHATVRQMVTSLTPQWLRNSTVGQYQRVVPAASAPSPAVSETTRWTPVGHPPQIGRTSRSARSLLPDSCSRPEDSDGDRSQKQSPGTVFRLRPRCDSELPQRSFREPADTQPRHRADASPASG